MRDKSVFKRSILPALILLSVTLAAMFGYFNLRVYSNTGGMQSLVKLLGLIYFISVAFGTLVIFTISAIGGAPLKERVLASFAVPFFWMTKEVIRITESHPLLESLYWYLNPLNVWLITLMVLEMGIAVLISRRVLKARGQGAKVLSKGPVLVIGCSLVFVIAVYSWGKGENVYVIFLSGYRLLFGSGV